jgi:hypothetical protein
MSKQLNEIELVLPRLAKNLYRELQRYRKGKLDDAQFTECFENLLQSQHRWLITQGASEVRAALAVHGAVLVLSGPGLRAEAQETGQPLEVIEFRAVREAATDVARSYPINELQAIRILNKIVARYGG